MEARLGTHWLGALFLVAACGSQPPDDFGGGGNGGGGPRLIAPQSLSRVTQQRPMLRWIGPLGASPEVDLCKDRACTMPLPTGVVLSADGQSAMPSSALPPGWVFWRVRFGPGAQPAISATWQFWVGTLSATSPVDTSSGAILDVNGDGYADFLVAGHDGVVHLCLGAANPTAADWTVEASARRIDIVTPFGAPPSTPFLASVGDVDGDGYGDFLVGEPGSSSNTPGNARLYFGSADPTAADWNGASPSRAIDVDPPTQAQVRAHRVAGVGDVNGDGYADFLVAGADAMYLYFGSSKPDATVWNTPPYALRAKICAYAQYPCWISVNDSSIAGAGDVNGDGYSDFLIVAHDGDLDITPPPPRLYLGSAAARGAAWSAASTSQRIDVIRSAVGDDATGNPAVGTVTGVGDVNGDGYADFILGIPRFGVGPPAAHLFLGSARPATDDLGVSSPATRIDLVSPAGGSAEFADAVSGAGDIDGDGYADFLVSAADSVHVYFGAAAPTSASWNNATSGRRIDLSRPDDPMPGSFGRALAGGGDIDGDGDADFFITETEGGVWLQLGTATPSAAVWTGASATRRIDLTQIAAMWVVAAVELIEGALGRYGPWEAPVRSRS